jgi:putative chitinase
MPRKKVFTKNKNINKEERRSIFSQLVNQIKSGESFTNLILGAIVIIVIAITVIVFIKNNKQGQTSSTTDDVSVEQEENGMTSSTYTIKTGDSLWSISEKTYKSGYNWKEIAKANNLENPGLIHAGNKLKLPSVKKEVVASDTMPDSKTVMTEETTVNSISGNEYSVKKGDNLWNISVRAYGDGFRYIEIAKANNLANPRLIHSGNVLKIPRG